MRKVSVHRVKSTRCHRIGHRPPAVSPPDAYCAFCQMTEQLSAGFTGLRTIAKTTRTLQHRLCVEHYLCWEYSC